MIDQILDFIGNVGSRMTFATLIGGIALIGSITFFALGVKSDKREWWVRAILVTTMISFCLGALQNDLIEYRFFYDIDSGGMSLPQWVEMLKYLRRSEMSVHFFAGAGLITALILQFLPGRSHARN